MGKMKNKLKIALIAFTVAGFAAIPLYSYAIDYTTSGNSNTTDLGPKRSLQKRIQPSLPVQNQHLMLKIKKKKNAPRTIEPNWLS